jgi:hypothetical protein
MSFRHMLTPLIESIDVIPAQCDPLVGYVIPVPPMAGLTLLVVEYMD